MRGPRGCLLGNPNTPPLTRPGWAEIHDVGRSFHSASYTLTVLRRQPKPHCRVPCGPSASWTCRRLISAVEISQRAVGRALSLPASERKAAGSTTWQHTPCVTACPRQEGSLRPRRKGGTHRCCGGWRGPGSPSPSGADAGGGGAQGRRRPAGPSSRRCQCAVAQVVPCARTAGKALLPSCKLVRRGVRQKRAPFLDSRTDPAAHWRTAAW